MTKSQLVLISVIRDALDLMVIGQIPGLNWLLNLPVIYLHYRYAGMNALITMVENIPGIETLPWFTLAALSYPSLPSSAPADESQKVIGI